MLDGVLQSLLPQPLLGVLIDLGRYRDLKNEQDTAHGKPQKLQGLELVGCSEPI